MECCELLARIFKDGSAKDWDGVLNLMIFWDSRGYDLVEKAREIKVGVGEKEFRLWHFLVASEKLAKDHFIERIEEIDKEFVEKYRDKIKSLVEKVEFCHGTFKCGIVDPRELAGTKVLFVLEKFTYGSEVSEEELREALEELKEKIMSKNKHKAILGIFNIFKIA